jgi:hypothetical protein
MKASFIYPELDGTGKQLDEGASCEFHKNYPNIEVCYISPMMLKTIPEYHVFLYVNSL